MSAPTEPREVPATELRHLLGEYLDAVRYNRQPIAVMRHGRVVALLTAPTDEGSEK